MNVHDLMDRIQGACLRLFCFGTAAREDFYEQLALLVGNGIKIKTAIKEIYDVSMEGKKNPAGVSLIYKDFMVGMDNGEKFSTVLTRWVGVQEGSVIAAGEKSGELLASFSRVAQAVKRRKMLVGACAKPLVLPCILFVLVFGVMLFTGYGFAPRLLELVPLDKWTGATRTLLSIGLFFKAWWPVIVAAVAVTVGVFVWSLGHWTGSIRAKVDHLGVLWAILCPPVAGYGIYRIYQASLFLDNVAQMLSSGVKLDHALELLKGYCSDWLRERIEGAEQGIGRGARLGDALGSSGYDFPDKQTIGFLRVLESTEGIAQALEKFTERWVELNVKKIALAAIGIRLFAFIVVGAAILIFFGGVYGVSQVASALQQGAVSM